MRAGKRLIATWHFIGIEVYNLEAEVLLASELAGLLPLVPFAHNGGEEAIIERAAFEIYDRAAESERADLEVLLGVFGARAIGRPSMQAILGRLPMSADLVKTSPLYQYWVEEGATQAARQSLLLVLRQRFPVLPPEVEAAIARADLATTETALAHAVTESLEQILARLSAPPA